MTNTTIITHRDADGFASAWVLRRWLLEQGHPEPTVFHAQYGEPLPELPEGVDTLYVLDFSYPADTLAEVAGRVAHVHVLDHHVSACNRLRGVALPENVYLSLDTSDAACAQVLSKYTPADRLGVDTLVAYVADRDTWRKVLHDTDEMSSIIESTPRFWGAWDTLALKLARGELTVELAEARGARKQLEVYADREAMRKGMRRIHIAGHEVPCTNNTFAVSETGHAMCLFHDCALSAQWLMDTTGTVRVALRAHPDKGVSAAGVAETLVKEGVAISGGGHPGAAGFVLANFAALDALFIK